MILFAYTPGNGWDTQYKQPHVTLFAVRLKFFSCWTPRVDLYLRALTTDSSPWSRKISIQNEAPALSCTLMAQSKFAVCCTKKEREPAGLCFYRGLMYIISIDSKHAFLIMPLGVGTPGSERLDQGNGNQITSSLAHTVFKNQTVYQIQARRVHRDWRNTVTECKNPSFRGACFYDWIVSQTWSLHEAVMELDDINLAEWMHTRIIILTHTTKVLLWTVMLRHCIHVW